jgi:hypothetical protein
LPTINDYKKAALKTLTGVNGDINTLEYKWLRSVVTPYVGAIPDMWRRYLNSLGYSGGLQDMMYDWLGGLGYTGSLNSRLYKFWKDGGGGNLLALYQRDGLLINDRSSNPIYVRG